MNTVVIVVSGPIGSYIFVRLTAQGHDVVTASPQTDMSALMGEGPVKTLAGAQVGVNDATLPSFEDDAVHQA